jgi:hypothetical protein
MKRNHVSRGKIRRLLVSLFALAILASAFFVTPLSAFADTPEQQCFDYHMMMSDHEHSKTYEESMAHQKKAFECVGYETH